MMNEKEKIAFVKAYVKASVITLIESYNDIPPELSVDDVLAWIVQAIKDLI